MERAGASFLVRTAWIAAERGAARRARFPLQTESVRDAASMVGERNEALPYVRGLYMSSKKEERLYVLLIVGQY